MIAGGQHLGYVLLQALELASSPFSQEGGGNRRSCKAFPEHIWKGYTHLVRLSNAPLCVIHSLLQGNTWLHSLCFVHGREDAQKPEMALKWEKESAAQLDWSCSSLCCWHNISLPMWGSASSCCICLVSASFVPLKSSFIQSRILQPRIPIPAPFL